MKKEVMEQLRAVPEKLPQKKALNNLKKQKQKRQKEICFAVVQDTTQITHSTSLIMDVYRGADHILRHAVLKQAGQWLTFLPDGKTSVAMIENALQKYNLCFPHFPHPYCYGIQIQAVFGEDIATRMFPEELEKWEQEQTDRRRHKKQSAEQKETAERMKAIPQITGVQAAYLKKYAFQDEGQRFVIFTPSQKKKKNCVCVYCRKSFDAENVKYKGTVTCPHCRTEQRAETIKRLSWREKNAVEHMSALHIVSPTEIWLRKFGAVRKISHNETTNKIKVKTELTETERIRLKNQNGKMICEKYKYNTYVGNEQLRWIKTKIEATEKWFYMPQISPYDTKKLLFTLPQTQRIANEMFQLFRYGDTNHRNRPATWQAFELVYNLMTFPHIEMLWKAGLHNNVVSLLCKRTTEEELNRYTKNSAKPKLNQKLGITKATLKSIAAIDNTYNKALQKAVELSENMELKLSVKQIQKIQQTENDRSHYTYFDVVPRIKEALHILKNAGHTNMEKALEYTTENNIENYLDYLAECEKLHWNLGKSKIAFPKDLQAAHEKSSELIHLTNNKKIDDAIQKIYKQWSGKLILQQNDIIMRIPKNLTEFIEEGKQLHHCVKNYAAKYAKGETTIIFMRKASTPETPYFTAEVKNGRVIQCHTMRNQSAEKNSNEEKAIHLFIQKMSGVIEKETAFAKKLHAG